MTVRAHASVHSWLSDMDGVLVHEEQGIPGAADFVARLRGRGLPFLLLTNNSIFTPRELQARLARSGIDVPTESIWTSALATARFLDAHRPRGTACVIGEAGLTTAMHEVGYVLSEQDPDYVVLGETRTYSFEVITKAIRLVEAGPIHCDESGSDRPLPARPPPHYRRGGGFDHPADRSRAVLRRQTQRPHDAIGAQPDRRALRDHGHGRRMQTDVIAGLEAGLRTILVLSGSTQKSMVDRFPYHPSQVVSSVAVSSRRWTSGGSGSLSADEVGAHERGDVLACDLRLQVARPRRRRVPCSAADPLHERRDDADHVPHRVEPRRVELLTYLVAHRGLERAVRGPLGRKVLLLPEVDTHSGHLSHPERRALQLVSRTTGMPGCRTGTGTAGCCERLHRRP